nr:unnamed protein product [Callosobruchus analis]
MLEIIQFSQECLRFKSKRYNDIFISLYKDSKREVSFPTIDTTNTCDIYSALTPEDEKNAEEEFEHLVKAL